MNRVLQKHDYQEDSRSQAHLLVHWCMKKHLKIIMRIIMWIKKFKWYTLRRVINGVYRGLPLIRIETRAQKDIYSFKREINELKENSSIEVPRV